MTTPTKYRTHGCGELRAAHAGKSVALSGFVDRRLDERAIMLRDRTGLVRASLPKMTPPELEKAVKKLEPESVVSIEGICVSRAARDRDLETGEIEVMVKGLRVRSAAEPLPPELRAGEPALEHRLRHRQLDLRRPAMQRRLELRSRFLFEIRSLLHAEGFTEVETPLLGRFTPEGTGSYIVPAAPGKVFALPGTPQPYKQLLMAGGVERYFQIARSFRKEPELSPDRQPEFTTLDVEMAWVEEEDVFRTIEKLLAHVLEKALSVSIELPIPRLTYSDALERYGTDAPDLRFGLELADLTRLTLQSPVRELRESGGVRGIRVPAAEAQKLRDDDLDRTLVGAARKALGTLTWSRVTPAGALRGPGLRFFGGKEGVDLTKALAAEPNDLLVFAISRLREGSLRLAGRAREALGRALGARPGHALAIVHEFPYFEFLPENEAFAACRHPFSEPHPDDVALIETDKHRARALGYDIVMDGAEIGAGSIRPHDLALQRRIFEMFEYKPEEVERRFGAVLDAFRFGVPPHGGFAIGLDRLLARLVGVEGIDEVIAFPKSHTGEDLLMGAPSAIEKGLLDAMLRE